MNKKLLLALLIFVLFPAVLRADLLEIRRPVNVYEKPDRYSKTVSRLDPAEMEQPFVKLVDPEKTNGYYNIRVSRYTTGWVYKTFVRMV
jgi:hypothetical protein